MAAFREAPGWGLTIRHPELGTWVFDQALTEEHGRESDVARAPVERNAPLGTHIQRKPRSLSVSIGHAATSLTQYTGETDRDTQAWRFLESIWAANTTVTVLTPFQTYANMAITKLTAPRDSTTGARLMANVSFTELRRVAAQFADVPDEYLTELRRVRHSAGTGAGAGDAPPPPPPPPLPPPGAFVPD